MLKKLRVPKTIQWVVQVFFMYLAVFTLFRMVTVAFFKPPNTNIVSLLPAFALGLKYDLRWIAFFLMPIVLLSSIKKFGPYYTDRNKKIWSIYLGIITLIILLFFGADIGQFAYVNTRLNADALIVMRDPKESLQTIWQSYPVIWIFIALIGSVAMMVWMFRRMHTGITDKNIDIHKFEFKKRWHGIALLILAWFMYGFLTVKPLNFYRAFSLNDAFKSNLALNPMQNFFTTLRFGQPIVNTDAAKYFTTISNHLGFEKNTGSNPYLRNILPQSGTVESNPNIVLVICESFSMYKSSLSGNPLNVTPYFAQLSKQGVFFNRCFTPSFGTARGVFATITGIPDVQLSKFATQNPETVTQRTIINSFTDYNKFYFIGGRSQFNNFKGLISNINNINIYEEGKFAAPKINVWGISDKNLFLEANTVFKQQQKPFFAIIQTADNHRPFNIPDEDKNFGAKNIPDETLKKYGFENSKEYNAFAYSDFCIKTFIETAKKENYFNNTIFVFIGDHGVEGNANAMYPKVFTEQRLTDNHVPLLFYAPNILAPQMLQKTISQIDVLPTLAGLLHQPYTNTTLGRDVLHDTTNNNAAFTISHAAGWIGLVTDSFYYRKHLRIDTDELHPIINDATPLTPTQLQQKKAILSRLTTAYYESAKWMLLNNK
jgi:phosphoglycerol transferase MdoB-like AlkP superfamily enzyme